MSQQADSKASELENLVYAVRHSAKYRHACHEVIHNIAVGELAKGRTAKETLKATKNKLHQIGAAYLGETIDYRHWTAELQRASHTGNREEMEAICRQIMRCQSSTRERLTILEQFYNQTLACLPPIRSVLDIACGLNPLSIYWMPVAHDVEYYAYDIYEDMVEFLNRFLEIAGIKGRVMAQDVTTSPPARPADLALILKSLPCLEQLAPGAEARLLASLPARYLLVSFPVYSLGGKRKGMLTHYEQHFQESIAGQPWSVQRFQFSTELAFLVAKPDPEGQAPVQVHQNARKG